MTVKQAYEIFYKPYFNEEITENFIRKSLSIDELKKAKANINKTYNKNTMLQRSKADPKNSTLKTLNTNDNIDKIIDEINKAYEILKKCINDPNYVNEEKEEKLLFTKYNQKVIEQREKTLNKQKNELYKAAGIYMYCIKRTIHSYTKKTKEKTTWENPIDTMFNEMTEYNRKNQQLINMLNKKNEELENRIALVERSELKDKDIDYIVQQLADKYYKHAKNEQLWEEITRLNIYLEDYFEKEYKIDKSFINNIKTKAEQRLKNAKDTFILITQNKCILVIEKAMVKLNNKTIPKIEKLKIVNECLELIEQSEKQMDNADLKYNEYIKIIKNYKNITLKEANQIEQMVRELITPNYIDMLNEAKIKEEFKIYQEKNPTYEKNKSEITKIHKKTRNALKLKITDNIKNIKKIDHSYESLSLKKINELSTDKLIEYNQTIKNDTIKILKEKITENFELIMIHYLNEESFDMLLTEEKYEIMYDEAINSSNYKSLQEIYNKFTKEVNQLSINDNKEKVRLNAKKRLFDEINLTINEIKHAGGKIPHELELKIKNAESLNILQLYNLSNDLSEYFLNSVFIEYDFKRKTK